MDSSRLFTVISEHICFLLLVFPFLHFLVVGSVRQIKLTHVGFRAHVKIASRDVSDRFVRPVVKPFVQLAAENRLHSVHGLLHVHSTFPAHPCTELPQIAPCTVLGTDCLCADHILQLVTDSAVRFPAESERKVSGTILLFSGLRRFVHKLRCKITLK